MSLPCRYFVISFQLLLVSILIIGCTHSDEKSVTQGEPPSEPVGKIKSIDQIFVSTYVLQSVVETILQHRADYQVRRIFSSEMDVASSQPAEQTRSALQSARLIILNGAHLETGLQSVDLPIARTIKSSRLIKDAWLTYPPEFAGATHQHGPSGPHQHRGVDGHTWMSPKMLKRQVETIAEEIGRRGVPYNRVSLDQVLTKLDQLWDEWRQLSPKLSQRVLMCNHPAYQYLTRDLGVQMKVLDIDPSQPISPSSVAKLEAFVKQSTQEGRQVLPMMWWESEPSIETLQSIAHLAIEHVVISPLEHPPLTETTKDVVELMRDQVHSLKRRLKFQKN